MSDLERIYNPGPTLLDRKGRSCDVCGEYVSMHDWIDLDTNGFIRACSNQKSFETTITIRVITKTREQSGYVREVLQKLSEVLEVQSSYFEATDIIPTHRS